MEIIYLIITSVVNMILTLGSVVYFHCRLNKMDLRIEHEIKNQKHTQNLLKELKIKND